MKCAKFKSAEDARQNCCVQIMSPCLVPIATILTGICLCTTNVSDINYHVGLS